MRPLELTELDEPMARAPKLAEKMARVLRNEEITDAIVALALLATGVVEHYVSDFSEACDLMLAIRGLEDRLLAAAHDVQNTQLH
jgi:hypothetical protein